MISLDKLLWYLFAIGISMLLWVGIINFLDWIF